MSAEKVYGFSVNQVHAAYASNESQTHIDKIVIKVD